MTTDHDTAAAPGQGGEQASREQAAAIFRAVADLIESRPDLPEPSAHVWFFLSGYQRPDIPAALAAITAALPCRWRASIRRGSADDSLSLDYRTGKSAATGTEVSVSVPADAVCAPAGTKTVTTWQLLPEVAALPGMTVLEDQ